MSLLRAWLPYLIIAVGLVVTRIPALGIKAALQKAPFIVNIGFDIGQFPVAYTLKWAFVPGTMFILVALLTIAMHRMKGHEVGGAWKDSFKQVSGATVAVIFGLALVQIMKSETGTMNSMIYYMAEALSKAGRALYTVFSPIIGVLGAFVSGSNTVSNTLFTNLQYQSAANLGLDTVIVVAMQIIGGAIGNMICVNNVVAACATVGTPGKEGKIIRINTIPTVIYVAGVILVMAAVLFLF